MWVCVWFYTHMESGRKHVSNQTQNKENTQTTSRHMLCVCYLLLQVHKSLPAPSTATAYVATNTLIASWLILILLTLLQSCLQVKMFCGKKTHLRWAGTRSLPWCWPWAQAPPLQVDGQVMLKMRGQRSQLIICPLKEKILMSEPDSLIHSGPKFYCMKQDGNFGFTKQVTHIHVFFRVSVE